MLTADEIRLDGGGGTLSIVDYTGKLRPKEVPSWSLQFTKGWENCYLSILKVTKIHC